MTTPQSPPTPPSPPYPPYPSGHSRTTIIAALITAAATITGALITTLVVMGAGSSEAGGRQAAAETPSSSAQSPTPTPSPTSTPSASTDSISTPSASASVTGAEVRPGRLPTEFSGAWVGTATELDTDSVDSYRVRLELTGGDVGNEVGEVHYEMAASECHGVVTLTGMDPDNAAVTLGEYIESGNCVKGGRIILTAEPDGALDFAYTGFKRDGTEQSVNASLEKVR